MNFILEVSDTLLALLREGGPTDPTLRRMIGMYRDVAEHLGCRAEYERMLDGVLAVGASKGAAPPPPRPGSSALTML